MSKKVLYNRLFRLSCINTNLVHTKFNLFDFTNVSCGLITIRTKDVPEFIDHNWTGDIQWNSIIPESLLQGDSNGDNKISTKKVPKNGTSRLSRFPRYVIRGRRRF